LIKPEQKAQSVRYKIKLVAANYLPAITISLPHQVEKLGHASAEAAKRPYGKAVPLTDEEKDAMSGLLAGETYPFHLSLTNPLYDPIQVKLSVQRMHVAAPSAADPSAAEKARRPPFVVSLSTTPFSVAAFAEAWEYDDDDDILDDDELEARLSGREKEPKPKTKTVGVLEKRANVTVVGGEVMLRKEARGNVKVCQPVWLCQGTLTYAASPV